MVELNTKRNNANEHDTPDGSDNSRNYEQTSDDERYTLSSLLHSIVRRELLVQVSTLRHTQSTAGKCKTHAVTSVAIRILTCTNESKKSSLESVFFAITCDEMSSVRSWCKTYFLQFKSPNLGRTLYLYLRAHYNSSMYNSGLLSFHSEVMPHGNLSCEATQLKHGWCRFSTRDRSPPPPRATLPIHRGVSPLLWQLSWIIKESRSEIPMRCDGTWRNHQGHARFTYDICPNRTCYGLASFWAWLSLPVPTFTFLTFYCFKYFAYSWTV
jgi:hypothetical protein